MEIELGADTNVPVHLSELPFGMKELNKITSIFAKVCLKSK